jgi:hypothetical protein
MKPSQKKGMVSLGILAVIGLCCIVLVSPVSALYPNDKWLTNNVTVYANNSNYATIGGVLWTNEYFFAVTGNGNYNSSWDDAWVWQQDPDYTNRYYMEQINIADNNGNTVWYPETINPSLDWGWDFTNGLNTTCTIYKKGLGGYVNPGSGTYYAWYGNKTNAAEGPYHNSSWYDLTYENATYVINLTELNQ